jgi:pimeloyl-ACP methyl ester carboxylesterase
MTYFLNLRAQSVGGDPATEVAVLGLPSINDLVQQIRGKDVLLATHGFNVDLSHGFNSLTLWEDKLSLSANVVFIGVLWPGDSWIPVIDYPFEGNEATRSGQLLSKFLDANFTEAASLSFVSHSLGARMVLETIRQLSRRVSNLVLMAGAIDDDCLTDEYQDAANKVDSISVLASYGDEVLSLAFPAGNFLGGIISRGHPYWHAALGREGPATISGVNLHTGDWQIPNEWNYGHGNYLPGPSGVPLPPPVDLPTLAVVVPGDTSAWSAGFVSTRLG